MIPLSLCHAFNEVRDTTIHTQEDTDAGTSQRQGRDLNIYMKSSTKILQEAISCQCVLTKVTIASNGHSVSTVIHSNQHNHHFATIINHLFELALLYTIQYGKSNCHYQFRHHFLIEHQN